VDPSDPLAGSLSALGRFFVGENSLDQTVQRVVEIATDAIPAAAMTGITMFVEHEPRTAFFTDPAAVDIDQAQYTEGHGPCLHAFRHSETVRIDHLEADDRWPAFRNRAFDAGIRSTLSLPMVADGRRPVGALNFYSRVDAGFDGQDEALGLLFGQQAAIVLANAQTYWDSHDFGVRIEQAQADRAVIEQAKGMLMAASNIDADRAFELLIGASQRENRKLRDIAAEIVTRRGRSIDG
jgi:GAF domain-containing protein